jgi:hypothetical protein
MIYDIKNIKNKFMPLSVDFHILGRKDVLFSTSSSVELFIPLHLSAVITKSVLMSLL